LSDDLIRENAELRSRLDDVMRAGDLEHARMAALYEACEALADFIESYAPDSQLALSQPTFYGIFRVYGKNARAAVAAVRPQADAFVARLADLSRTVGEQNTTIGYQDAMLSLLRGAALNLLDQLALAQGDDDTYWWRIGGRGLDEAYKALGRAVDTTKASAG
jgi:hypothetical protein